MWNINRKNCSLVIVPKAEETSLTSGARHTGDHKRGSRHSNRSASFCLWVASESRAVEHYRHACCRLTTTIYLFFSVTQNSLFLKVIGQIRVSIQRGRNKNNHDYIYARQCCFVRYLLGLYLYHYGKVDVTMEICAAAEKQQWTVEAGSMAGQMFAF